MQTINRPAPQGMLGRARDAAQPRRSPVTPSATPRTASWDPQGGLKIGHGGAQGPQSQPTQGQRGPAAMASATGASTWFPGGSPQMATMPNFPGLTPRTATLGPSGTLQVGHSPLPEDDGVSLGPAGQDRPINPPQSPTGGPGGAPRPPGAQPPGEQSPGNADFDDLRAGAADVSGELDALNNQGPPSFLEELDNILGRDSTLNRRAQNRGQTQANQRGLLNSSLAIGAGQSALYDQAGQFAGAESNLKMQDYLRRAGFLQEKDLSAQDYLQRLGLGEQDYRAARDLAEQGFGFDRFLQDSDQRFRYGFQDREAVIALERREDEQAHDITKTILDGNIEGGLRTLDADLEQRSRDYLRNWQVADRDFEANRNALEKYADFVVAARKDLRETITQISTSPDLNPSAKQQLIAQYIQDTNHAIRMQEALLTEFGLTAPIPGSNDDAFDDFGFQDPAGPDIAPETVAPPPEGPNVDDQIQDILDILGGINPLPPAGPGAPGPTQPGQPGRPGQTPPGDGVGTVGGNNPPRGSGDVPEVGATNERGDRFYGEDIGWLGNYKGAGVVDPNTGIYYQRQADGSITQRTLQPGDVVWSSGRDSHVYVREDGTIDFRPFQYD